MTRAGKKKDSAATSPPAEMVGVWEEGHRSGSKEAFRWSLEFLTQARDKAGTDRGKRALEFAMKGVLKEFERRYPKESETS